MNANERKTVLVVRRTRLDELVARYHTLSQARFYIEHLGADFGDYLRESAAYAAALQAVVQALEARGRYQIVDRALVPNFVFGTDDIVVALGQDGMVANTMKYLDGQPLTLRSRMPDHGVIFSDGMEADYLQFTAGMQATIGLSDRQGCLVV